MTLRELAEQRVLARIGLAPKGMTRPQFEAWMAGEIKKEVAALQPSGLERGIRKTGEWAPLLGGFLGPAGAAAGAVVKNVTGQLTTDPENVLPSGDLDADIQRSLGTLGRSVVEDVAAPSIGGKLITSMIKKIGGPAGRWMYRAAISGKPGALGKATEIEAADEAARLGAIASRGGAARLRRSAEALERSGAPPATASPASLWKAMTTGLDPARAKTLSPSEQRDIQAMVTTARQTLGQGGKQIPKGVPARQAWDYAATVFDALKNAKTTPATLAQARLAGSLAEQASPTAARALMGTRVAQGGIEQARRIGEMARGPGGHSMADLIRWGMTLPANPTVLTGVGKRFTAPNQTFYDQLVRGYLMSGLGPDVVQGTRDVGRRLRTEGEEALDAFRALFGPQ